MAGSPRIIARPTTRSPAACRRARVRQGQAFGGAEEAPSLTAAAPRRRWKYAVGTEECSRRGSNKRMECKGRPKWRDAPLTKKAPYKPDGVASPPSVPIQKPVHGLDEWRLRPVARVLALALGDKPSSLAFVGSDRFGASLSACWHALYPPVSRCAN